MCRASSVSTVSRPAYPASERDTDNLSFNGVREPST